MSLTYLIADLGPGEIELEKLARKLRAGGKGHPQRYERDHAVRLAENAAHQCRMLARQIARVKAAAEKAERPVEQMLEAAE
jgi:hypothetical protein